MEITWNNFKEMQEELYFEFCLEGVEEKFR